jgi:prolyl-tRNA synthetase
LEKLESLMDSYMTLGVSASKVSLSGLSSTELWKQSGRLPDRLQELGHEFFAVRDKVLAPGEDERLILAPTCEEEITSLVKTRLAYGESLPLRLYQIERKYRNEMRPRKGLLRSREFVMKDLYTFDSSQDAALETYELVRKVYSAFFESLGVPFLVAEADSGNMGGKLSHEYHYVSDLGEDVVWTCTRCKYTANNEVVPKNRANSSSNHSCPKCKAGHLIPHRTIEIGHTFFLGDKYTQAFDCRIPPQPGKTLATHAQMGCYGIGISRLVGALAAMCQRPASNPSSSVDKPEHVNIQWPGQVAPFGAIVISNKKKYQAESAAVYDAISGHRSRKGGVDAVMDDRPNKSLMFKLKDAEMHGIPVICVLGEAWEREGKVEVRSTGADGAVHVEFVPLENVGDTALKLFNNEVGIKSTSEE